MEALESVLPIQNVRVPEVDLENVKLLVVSSYERLATLVQHVASRAGDSVQHHAVYVGRALTYARTGLRTGLEELAGQIDPRLMTLLQQYPYIPVLILISGSVLVLVFVIFRRYFSSKKTDKAAEKPKIEELKKDEPPKPKPRWKRTTPTTTSPEPPKKESSPITKAKKFWSPKSLKKEDKKEEKSQEQKPDKSPRSWFRKSPKPTPKKAEPSKTPEPVVEESAKSPVKEETKSKSSWFAWGKSNTTTENSPAPSNMADTSSKSSNNMADKSGGNKTAHEEKRLFGRSFNLNIDANARPVAETKKMKKAEIDLVRTMGKEFREYMKLDEAGQQEREERKKDMEKVKGARSYFRSLDRSSSRGDDISNRFNVAEENLEGTGLSVGDLNLVKRRSTFYQQNGSSQNRLSQFQPGKLDKRIGSLFEGDTTDNMERQRPPRKKLITLDQVLKKESPDGDEDRQKRAAELEELKEARKRWVPPEVEKQDHEPSLISKDETLSQISKGSVKARWNPDAAAKRDQNSKSLILPNKLATSTFDQDNKLEYDVNKSNEVIKNELQNLRDSRPTPVTKRWQPQKKMEKPRSHSAHVLQRSRMPDDSWVLEKSSKAEEEKRKGLMELEMVRRARQESSIGDDSESSAESRMEQQRLLALKELDEVRKLRLAGLKEVHTKADDIVNAKEERLREIESLMKSRASGKEFAVESTPGSKQPAKSTPSSKPVTKASTAVSKTSVKSVQIKETAGSKSEEKIESKTKDTGKPEKPKAAEAVKKTSAKTKEQDQAPVETKKELPDKKLDQKIMQKKDDAMRKLSSMFTPKKSEPPCSSESAEVTTSVVNRDMDNKEVTCTTVTQHIAEKHKQHVVRSRSTGGSGVRNPLPANSGPADVVKDRSDGSIAKTASTSSAVSAISKSSSSSSAKGLFKKSKPDTAAKDVGPDAKDSGAKASIAEVKEDTYAVVNKPNKDQASKSKQSSVTKTTAVKEQTSQESASLFSKSSTFKDQEAKPKQEQKVSTTSSAQPRPTAAAKASNGIDPDLLLSQGLGPRFQRCNLKADSSGGSSVSFSDMFANSKVVNAKPKPFAASLQGTSLPALNGLPAETGKAVNKPEPPAPKTWSRTCPAAASSSFKSLNFSEPQQTKVTTGSTEKKESKLFTNTLTSSYSAAAEFKTETSFSKTTSGSASKVSSGAEKKVKSGQQSSNKGGVISMDSLKLLLSKDPARGDAEDAGTSDHEAGKSVTFKVDDHEKEEEIDEAEEGPKSGAKREGRVATKFKQIKDKTVEIRDRSLSPLRKRLQEREAKSEASGETPEEASKPSGERESRVTTKLKQLREKTSEDFAKIRDRSMSPIKKKLEERETKKKEEELKKEEEKDASSKKEDADVVATGKATGLKKQVVKKKPAKGVPTTTDVSTIGLPKSEDKTADTKSSTKAGGATEAGETDGGEEGPVPPARFADRFKQFKDSAVETVKTRAKSLQRKQELKVPDTSSEAGDSPTGSQVKLTRTRSESRSVKAIGAVKGFADHLFKKR